MTRRAKRTDGARALARILRENGELADTIRARFDKSVLSRLASGERGPSIETGAALAIITERRNRKIPESAWCHKGALARLVRE